MTPLLLLAALLFLGAAAYQAGRRRALAAAGGDLRRLHSLPNYYGVYVALWCALPALLVLALWVALQGRIVEAVLVSELPAQARALPPERLDAAGQRGPQRGGRRGGAAAIPVVQAAARRYLEHQRTATAALVVVTLALALAGGAVAWRRVRPRLAAITAVERIVKALLLAGSLRRRAHHRRHRAVAAVRGAALLPARAARRVPVRPAVEPADGDARRPGGQLGPFGAVPLFTGTLLISRIAMAVAGAGRAVLGDLPRRVRPRPHRATRSSRCSRSSPASRPWSTASSPRSPWRRCCAAPARRWGCRWRRRARSPPAW